MEAAVSPLHGAILFNALSSIVQTEIGVPGAPEELPRGAGALFSTPQCVSSALGPSPLTAQVRVESARGSGDTQMETKRNGFHLFVGCLIQLSDGQWECWDF